MLSLLFFFQQAQWLKDTKFIASDKPSIADYKVFAMLW